MEAFDHTVVSRKSFDEAVEAVVAESKKRGFGVLQIHDVQNTLAGKGFPRGPLKIIEICHPGYAARVLDADIKASLMLPCPISVYVENGRTVISAMRPKAIAGFFPGAGIESLAAEVDAIIVEIVDRAA